MPDIRAGVERRIFLAIRKGEDPDRIMALSNELVSRAARALPGGTVVVTDGASDFSRHFDRCGSWDGWIRDVALGVRYSDREPRYHAYIVPERTLGRATAQIVGLALGVSKPVLFWTGGDVFARVVGVQEVDPRDWKSGSVLQLVGGA